MVNYYNIKNFDYFINKEKSYFRKLFNLYSIKSKFLFDFLFYFEFFIMLLNYNKNFF